MQGRGWLIEVSKLREGPGPRGGLGLCPEKRARAVNPDNCLATWHWADSDPAGNAPGATECEGGGGWFRGVWGSCDLSRGWGDSGEEASSIV